LIKSLSRDDNADVKMVGMVVGILVTLIIAVLVFYTIAGSVDTSTIDDNFNFTGGGASETWATNATDDTLDQAGTFFSIAPIIAIVVVAVVILGYVSRI